MSGTVKGLIAGIAAIVVLGGGIAALKLTEPKPDTGVPDPSVSYSDNLTIYNGNANDIKSISVKNTNGGYKLIRTAEVTETKMPEYKIEGLENVKLNDTIVGSLPANVATLEALKVIEEDAADMSKYGLDKSDIEATIEFDGENAKTVTLVVGNDTAEGNVYVALKGEKTVYTVSSSSVSSYVYEKEYFVFNPNVTRCCCTVFTPCNRYDSTYRCIGCWSCITYCIHSCNKKRMEKSCT